GRRRQARVEAGAALSDLVAREVLEAGPLGEKEGERRLSRAAETAARDDGRAGGAPRGARREAEAATRALAGRAPLLRLDRRIAARDPVDETAHHRAVRRVVGQEERQVAVSGGSDVGRDERVREVGTAARFEVHREERDLRGDVPGAERERELEAIERVQAGRDLRRVVESGERLLDEAEVSAVQVAVAFPDASRRGAGAQQRVGPPDEARAEVAEDLVIEWRQEIGRLGRDPRDDGVPVLRDPLRCAERRDLRPRGGGRVKGGEPLSEGAEQALPDASF